MNVPRWRLSSSPAFLDQCALPGLVRVVNPLRGSTDLRAQQTGGPCPGASPRRHRAGRDDRPGVALRCAVHVGWIVARAFDLAVGTVALDWWFKHAEWVGESTEQIACVEGAIDETSEDPDCSGTRLPSPPR
jgi:hypothetical protein